jgi:hypothetical protein
MVVPFYFAVMETKTSIATELYNAGNFKEALAIFKTFKMGVNKAERDVLITTHEWLAGNGEFYATIGYNYDQLEKESRSIIENKLINK